MKLPKKIKVGCVDYDVVEWDDAEAVRRGRKAEIDHLNTEIRICRRWKDDAVKESVIHEVLHAIYLDRWMGLYLDGGDAETTEEVIVSQFGRGLAQVFRDNPQLVEFFGRGK